VTDQVVLAPSIFECLGVPRVINACGVYTDLGGSVPSARVRAAIEDVSRYYVSMPELLDGSGRVLAAMIGAEAARVTTGAAAAIVLAVGACMTGMDGRRWEQLPDTAGMPNEVLIQFGHRFKYDRCARVPGATLVRVGSADGTTAADLEAAIGGRTAVILFPAHLGKEPNTVPLEQVAAIARRRNIPLLVDAAYQNYPTSIMSNFTRAGADLVCFSAKYFGGPNGGGFIAGRRDLIEAIAGLDFTRFESGQFLTFGRPYKLDRQTVVGVVVALQEWFEIDHDARWAGYAEKVRTMARCVRGAAHVTAAPMLFTMDERLVPAPVNCLTLRFDSRSGKSALSVSKALAAGDPSIRTVVLDDVLVVAVDTVLDGQELIIGDRLRRALE
jgi:L-seryl-tRNA(Ser) seleniumtransferase